VIRLIIDKINKLCIIDNKHSWYFYTKMYKYKKVKNC
jgi:hypothetical protein